MITLIYIVARQPLASTSSYPHEICVTLRVAIIAIKGPAHHHAISDIFSAQETHKDIQLVCHLQHCLFDKARMQMLELRATVASSNTSSQLWQFKLKSAQMPLQDHAKFEGHHTIW